MAKFKALESEGYLPSFVKNITTFDSEVIAIVSNKTTTNGKTSIKISVSSEIFIDIIAADPTVNKMYSQWILSLFSNLLKLVKKRSGTFGD
jgi:3D (Asp-Asp-Asp) domain-containing protein